MLSPDPIGGLAGEIVGEGLRYPEHDDEGEDRSPSGQVEFLLGDRGQNAAFHAHHRANEGIDDDEERKLRDIFSETQSDNHAAIGHHDGRHALASTLVWPRLNARIRSISSGFGGTFAKASMKE